MAGEVDRRGYVKLLATATVGSLSGCTAVRDFFGGEFGNPGTVPEWVHWVTTEEEPDTYYAYVALADIDDQIGGPSSEPLLDDPYQDDVMLHYPITALILGGLSSGFSLRRYGLGDLVGAKQSVELQSSAKDVLFTNDTMVVTGDIDPDEIGTQLRTEPRSEMVPQFELSGTIDEYDVFLPADDQSRGRAVGLTDGTLVLSTSYDRTQAHAVVRTTIDAKNGKTSRAIDDDERFGWMMASAGAGHLSYGELRPQKVTDGTPTGTQFDGTEGNSAFDVLEDSPGFVSSLTIGGEQDGTTGEFAAAVRSDGRDRVRDGLGISADDASIDVANDRVYSTATWSGVSTLGDFQESSR